MYTSPFDAETYVDGWCMSYKAAVLRTQKRAAMTGLELAAYFDDQMTRLSIPALPATCPIKPLLGGFKREVTADDFETFAPVRLKQSADIQDMADDLKDARRELGVLNERVDYLESLYESIHAALMAAGIADGHQLTMVCAAIDGDDNELAVAS